jgi:UDP-glucose:O-linked fucose beta-1,3-glucosyltransferase
MNRETFVLFAMCTVFTVSYVNTLTIIVLSQPNTYHVARAKQFRQHIEDQANHLNITAPTVLLLHEEWTHVGAWTILPIIPSLAEESDLKSDAIMFCNEDAHVELHRFLAHIAAYDFSQELFIGRGLRDREPTIIHHFAFHENPSSFIYPDFSTCFILSFPLIKSLSSRLKTAF